MDKDEQIISGLNAIASLLGKLNDKIDGLSSSAQTLNQAINIPEEETTPKQEKSVNKRRKKERVDAPPEEPKEAYPVEEVKDKALIPYTFSPRGPVKGAGVNLFEGMSQFNSYKKDTKEVDSKIQRESRPPKEIKFTKTKVECNECHNPYMISPELAQGDIYVCDKCLGKRRGR